MAPTALFALSERHVEHMAQLDPIDATFMGVEGHDDRLTDYSPAGHEARADAARTMLQALSHLPDSGPDDRLARVTYPLLSERYGDDPKARARLEEELGLIRRHQLAGFFLTYADIMRLAGQVADEVRGESVARRVGNIPPGRGRGSSVSSIVCYLLGLSHIDPVQHDLFLGRFLHEEIIDVPDIDLTLTRTTDAGIEVIVPPTDEGYAVWSVLRDPFGVVFALASYSELGDSGRQVRDADGRVFPIGDRVNRR